MDTLINDRIENPSSLDGLYTDFDKWLVTYRAYYQRSIGRKEYESEKELSIDSKRLQCKDDLLLEVFIADILLKQRHKTHTAVQPFSNFREKDGFMFYDYILYGLLNKNGNKSIVYKMVRSKL